MLKKLLNKFKKSVTKNPKHTVLFVAVVLVALFTRFYLLKSIPTFVYQDEMGYLISSITLTLNGSDIVGTWNPLSITPVSPKITALAELTTQFIAPFYLLPLSPIIAGRLPFVLMSLLVPLFIAGIVYETTRSKSTAKWAAFISVFNPWIWQVGRLAVDPYVSFFFYIVGGYLILKLKSWKKLFSLPFLLFGFYNYQGHKLVFIFWVFMFVAYTIAPYINLTDGIKNIFSKFQLKKIFPSLTVLLVSLCVFAFYVLVQLPNQDSSERLNTIYTPAHPEVVKTVNEERRLSINSKLNSLVINKYTVWGREVFERFVETYGSEFLFIKGQSDNAAFSIWYHGVFYLIDGILFLFGFAYLIHKKRYGLLSFLLFGLVVSVIPSLISASRAYFYRSSLNIPLLIIFASVGANYFYSILPKFLKFLLPLIYVGFILNFMFLFFFRYPITGSTREFFSDRVLNEYIKRIPTSQKVVVLLPELEFNVSSYLFHTQHLNKENVADIQKMFQEKQYQIGNITFVNSCLPLNANEANEVIISRWDIRNCEPGEDSIFTFKEVDEDAYFFNPLEMQSIKDGGFVFKIYNDPVCLGQELNPYIYINSRDQFNFESQNNEMFCKNWIQKTVE